MLFKIIACLLITYGCGWAECKPWSDGYNQQNYNPHYGPEPITTSTTTRPLYPTLYPRYEPFAPAPSAPQLPPNQRPGTNPYDGSPLPPNNQGPYNNDYHGQPNANNNFNRPYDNTRTTYPPHIGPTNRPTFPTRQPYNTPPPGTRLPNGTISHSGNTTRPQHNYNNNPNSYNPNQNNNYNPTRVPNNSGNFGQNYDNNRGTTLGTTTYRPFPSTNTQPGTSGGNQYPNQPNSGFPHQNITPNRPNTGNQFPNQFNSGNQYPNQPNYNPNVSPNQPNYNPNSGPNQHQGSFTNPNDYRPSVPNVPQQTNTNQRPDTGSGGVVLAPFPNANLNNNGGQNQFNYDMNSQNRPTTSDRNGNVPLAGYTGAHVPLA